MAVIIFLGLFICAQASMKYTGLWYKQKVWPQALHHSRCMILWSVINDQWWPKLSDPTWRLLDTLNNITVTSWCARWRLKSPASRLFTQPFIQAQIKENIKVPRHWLCEGTGDRWIPHKGPETREMFPFDDVSMGTLNNKVRSRDESMRH